MIELIETGPGTGALRLLLAHGAGAPMTSPFMEEVANLLGQSGVSVARFEFSYMSERRKSGSRRPPPSAENLAPEFTSAISQVRLTMPLGAPLVIGGKSLGGRVASLVAEHHFRRGEISGLVCLGYPFHPPTRPEALRTAHLKVLTVPTLIVQGERDPFGARQEVEGYGLSSAVRMEWIPLGDHDLKPRKEAGLDPLEALTLASRAVAAHVVRCNRSDRQNRADGVGSPIRST